MYYASYYSIVVPGGLGLNLGLKGLLSFFGARSVLGFHNRFPRFIQESQRLYCEGEHLELGIFFFASKESSGGFTFHS